MRVTHRQGETHFKFSSPKGRSIGELESISLRTVTNAFLALDSTTGAKQFFERYGEWGKDHATGRKRSTVKWSEILAFQKMLKQAWTCGPDFRRWDKEIRDSVFDLELRPDLMKERPSLFICADCAQDLLLADLFFAALSGLPVGFCARRDCGKLFQKSTKHERKFCSTECAHIESVRQHRARKSQKRGA